MSKQVFIAVDLGAGSGRLIAAKTDFSKIHLEEIHRFDNPGTDLPDGSYWNMIGLYREILEGLRIAVDRYGDRIVSIGLDTWGCDFGLLDGKGQLLGMPHQYRDARHEGMPEALHEILPELEIFAHTGVRTNFYNTSLHLLAELKKKSPSLLQAEKLLFVPDLLAYWLTGRQAVERTVASTSQLLDPRSGDWAWGVIEALGLPSNIFGEIVAPGTVLGPIRDEVAKHIGMAGIPVVATACHDTAAAVAGIPMGADDNLWLSSGTWSIMGIETRESYTGPDAYGIGFCNELGVDGTVRFLKNIAGLWLIQECKRQWSLDGENLDYAALAELAKEAEPFTAFIDPDDPIFASPGDMPNKIAAWCEKTGQTVPKKKGCILRIASESLALKYRVTLDHLRNLTGHDFKRLHAGGGGIQNELLTQSTANALGIEVVAGPIEATSCGNLITQMIATGGIPDFEAGRQIIRDSFEFITYTPQEKEAWDAAYERFKKLLKP